MKSRGLAILERRERVKGISISSEESNSRRKNRGVCGNWCAIGFQSKALPIVGNSKPTIQISCEPKYRLRPLKITWARTIGVVCGDLLRSCGSAETHAGKMSKGRSGSYAESGSGRSSRGFTWRE